MKAVQKIMFQVEIKGGQLVSYMVDNKIALVLTIAALRKHHGKGNVRVIKGSIQLSKVIVMGNTVIAKAG